jgi:hypothetical protein
MLTSIPLDHDHYLEFFLSGTIYIAAFGIAKGSIVIMQPLPTPQAFIEKRIPRLRFLG